MEELVSTAVVSINFLGHPDLSGHVIQFTGMSVTADPSLMDADSLAAGLPMLLAHALAKAVEGNYVDLTELVL